MLRSARSLGNGCRVVRRSRRHVRKPGRPPEDRLKRQYEIFLAVAPLIERYGAKRLTMRQAARAAHLSLGGLYHYRKAEITALVKHLAPSLLALRARPADRGEDPR
jgi:hypothetical protein